MNKTNVDNTKFSWKNPRTCLGSKRREESRARKPGILGIDSVVVEEAPPTRALRAAILEVRVPQIREEVSYIHVHYLLYISRLHLAAYWRILFLPSARIAG